MLLLEAYDPSAISILGDAADRGDEQ